MENNFEQRNRLLFRFQKAPVEAQRTDNIAQFVYFQNLVLHFSATSHAGVPHHRQLGYPLVIL